MRQLLGPEGPDLQLFTTPVGCGSGRVVGNATHRPDRNAALGDGAACVHVGHDRGIELDQIREIGQMQGWLILWNAPLVGDGASMRWMADADGRHDHGDGARPMPGAVSVAEIGRDALRTTAYRISGASRLLPA